MRLTRLAVAAAGFSLALLGTAGPALAQETATPSPTPAQFGANVTPKEFKPGDTLTITAGPCDTAPTVSDPDGLFVEVPALTDPDGDGTYSGEAATKENLKPGKYNLTVSCGEQSVSGTVTVAKQPEPQKPFTASVSPSLFHAGDVLTFTTKNCPTVPTITDHNGLFVETPVLQKVNETTDKGKGTTKSSLVQGKTYKVTVTCKGVDKITFTTTPGKPVQKDDDQTSVIPEGGVDTGDGTMADRLAGGTTVPVAPLAGAAAVLVAGCAMVGIVTRRRALARENS